MGASSCLAGRAEKPRRLPSSAASALVSSTLLDSVRIGTDGGGTRPQLAHVEPATATDHRGQPPKIKEWTTRQGAMQPANSLLHLKAVRVQLHVISRWRQNRLAESGQRYSCPAAFGRTMQPDERESPKQWLRLVKALLMSSLAEIAQSRVPRSRETFNASCRSAELPCHFTPSPQQRHIARPCCLDSCPLCRSCAVSIPSIDQRSAIAVAA